MLHVRQQEEEKLWCTHINDDDDDTSRDVLRLKKVRRTDIIIMRNQICLCLSSHLITS